MKPDEQDHPTVPVSHGELSADIDVEIAPLILACWTLGIQTVHSCQDFRGCASITFENEVAAHKFVGHLDRFHEPEDSRYASGRPFPWFDVFELRYKGHEWPEAFSRLDKYPKVWKWIPDFYMEPPLRIHVQFPREDLPAVMKCFVEQAQKR